MIAVFQIEVERLESREMVDKRGLWERIYGESNLKRLKKSNREKYSLAYANQNHDYATSIKAKKK